MKQDTSSERDAEQQIDHREYVDEALYGLGAAERDQARARLIGSGSTSDLQHIVKALSAPLSVTRRRAVRLLSDLQPHRALPPLKRWVERLAQRGWPAEELTQKSIREGLVSAGRVMNQLTPRGDDEPTLLILWSKYIF